LCLVTASYLKVLLSYPYKSVDISRTWCSSVSVVPRPGSGAGKQHFDSRMLEKFSVPPNLARMDPEPTHCPICNERSFPVHKTTGLRSRLLTSVDCWS